MGVPGDNEKDKPKEVLDLSRYPIPAERPSLVHRGYWKSPGMPASQPGTSLNTATPLRRYPSSSGFAFDIRDMGSSSMSGHEAATQANLRENNNSSAFADGAGVASLRFLATRAPRTRSENTDPRQPNANVNDIRIIGGTASEESTVDLEFYEILSNPSIPSANDGDEADDEGGSTTTPLVLNSPSNPGNGANVPTLLGVQHELEATRNTDPDINSGNRILRWATQLPRHGVDAFSNLRSWRRPSPGRARPAGSAAAPAMPNNIYDGSSETTDFTVDRDSFAALVERRRLRSANRSRQRERDNDGT